MNLASFDLAYKLTKGKEGFASCDKDDPATGTTGKWTILGLTEDAEPNSAIWPIVREYQAKPGFPENMRGDSRLYEAARNTYRRRYWAPMGCDRIYSQVIANKLFDAGVNIGTETLSIFLQFILNCFNKKATLWPDLDVDGSVGSATTDALQDMLSQENGEMVLYRALDAAQCCYYLVGREAFKALAAALRVNPPPQWRETFEWGWEVNRTADYDEALKQASA